MEIILAHPLPGAADTGGFRWRDAFTENGVYVPAMLHNGQDYGASAGTPIRAAHNGKVVWSGWDTSGGGWGVMLQHPDGWSTLYFHMQYRSTDVTIGQTVTAGQTVGRVGMSGLATGNHLHFMLRVNGKDVDPVPYLKATEPEPKPKPIPAHTPEPTLGDLMAFKSVGIGYRPDEKKDRLITVGLDFESGQRTEAVVDKSYGTSWYGGLTEGGFKILTKGHYDNVLKEFDAAVAEKRAHELAVARASAGA